ncbi:MAG: DM13 domain-containing protein [Magnetospiraceae bacterium]
MWRYAAVFLTGGLLGTAFGVAVGFFAFPYVFPPPEAMETLTAEEQTAVIAQGQFIHANPSDPIHHGTGGVTVYENTVFLQADFEVGPGPAYRVYLVPKTGIRKNEDMDGVMFVDLGGLRAFKGSQKYAIPPGVDLKNYPSVVIWCVEFGALISPADLTF